MIDEARRIADHVAGRYTDTGFVLPVDAVRDRAGGHAFLRGWHFGWTWGTVADAEFLDLLSQHRMTDDLCERFFADGVVDHLPTVNGWVSYPLDCSQAERERIQRQQRDRNREIAGDLRRRGLLPPLGRNVPAHDVNEALHTRLLESE